MGRKKKSELEELEIKEKALSLSDKEVKVMQQAYNEDLETNPKYSLVVDPENKYSMTDVQKRFVKQYVEFKSVNLAAELVGIDVEMAKSYFISYSCQQEIRRLNMALYHRQFANKLLSLDEIGGYLTSILTGENVPLADQLKPSEKLKVVDMMIKLNEMKRASMVDPSIIMATNIDMQIKDLSVATIQQLLSVDKSRSNMKEIQEYSQGQDLTPEETAYLSTLPTKDLLKMIEDTNKGG